MLPLNSGARTAKCRPSQEGTPQVTGADFWYHKGCGLPFRSTNSRFESNPAGSATALKGVSPLVLPIKKPLPSTDQQKVLKPLHPATVRSRTGDPSSGSTYT